METKTESRAPRISIIIEKKDAPPSSSEDFIEHQLRLYLETAPEEEQKVMQDEEARKRVLEKLERLRPVLPVLERVSEVTELEAQKLSVEVKTVLEDRISDACRVEVLEERNRILERKLRTDALTGVASIHAYQEDITRAMDQSVETGRPLWCFAVDVDDLKRINDLYGHETGNKVLRELARRMNGAVRRGDTIYRPGGDEFILLSGVDSEDSARAVAERLLTAVNSQVVVVQTEKGIRRIPISVSIGISQFDREINGNDRAEGKEAMEISADNNLYLAKGAGRNRAFMGGRELPQEAHSDRAASVEIKNSSEPVPDSRSNLAIARGS